MGFREQVTKPNVVGEWIREYRRNHDMSVTELQNIFNKENTLGVPVSRVETTTSPMTKVVSQPIIDYFEEDEELIKAFKEHNRDKLTETYEV